LSIAVAIFIGWYLFRSRHGFEIAMFGDNRQFSVYAGMNNQWIFIRTMLTSGALAGLAGGLEVLGSMHRLPSDFAANLGFQGIAVSLVSQNNPFGIVLGGLFFGGLKTGGTNLQLQTDTPRDVVDVISAIVILVITARVGLRVVRAHRPRLLNRLVRSVQEGETP
jgi:simple sugar transport system permease protein